VVTATRSFLAPMGALDNKPVYGAPCNGCGLCCIASLCALGQHVFGRIEGPCPALGIDDDLKSSCGLVTASTPEMSAAAKLIIGAGDGCDARFDGEPQNQETVDKFTTIVLRTARAFKQAKFMWGMR